MKKPSILWVVDVPNWAFDARFKNIADKLDKYDHVVIYLSLYTLAEVIAVSKTYDIIFCSYVCWLKRFDPTKTVVALTCVSQHGIR